MANMSIGGYTLSKNPTDMKPTILQPKKRDAVSDNFGGGDYYSWGLSWVGVERSLYWDFIPATEFDTLEAMFEQDLPVVFDPQDGTGRTFTVVLRKCDGSYFIKLDNTGYRQEVEVLLNIRERLT